MVKTDKYIKHFASKITEAHNTLFEKLNTLGMITFEIHNLRATKTRSGNFSELTHTVLWQFVVTFPKYTSYDAKEDVRVWEKCFDQLRNAEWEIRAEGSPISATAVYKIDRDVSLEFFAKVESLTLLQLIELFPVIVVEALIKEISKEGSNGFFNYIRRTKNEHK